MQFIFITMVSPKANKKNNVQVSASGLTANRLVSTSEMTKNVITSTA